MGELDRSASHKKTRLRVNSMSFSAEAQKRRQIHDVVESSDGMTLVKVIAVGTTGFFIGTPETAAAALGTALRGLEVRVRRSVEWVERRQARKEEGRGSKGGYGGQPRRPKHSML